MDSSNRPDDTTTSANSAQARRFFQLGCATLVGVVVYTIVSAHVDRPELLWLGLASLVLACLPALIWSRSSSQTFPIFEVFILTTGNAYALPLLSSHQASLQLFAPESVVHAALGVLLFQLVALVTYLRIPGHARTSPFWTEEIISRDMIKLFGYGITLTTVYNCLTTFILVLPPEIEGTLRAVVGGIGIVCTFVMSRFWGSGQLKSDQKILLCANLIIQSIVQFSTLFLVGGISMLVLALLGFMSTARRLPLVLTTLLVALLAVLHNGKSAMRDQYWDSDGNHQQVTVSELPAFYWEWINEGLKPSDESGDRQLATKLIDRTSLMHILCLVVDTSPSRLDFLYGKTYGQIPGQFVPRPLWPNKPPGHISTYTLAIYYGLQNEEDTAKTIIGFGLIAEAYANFGFFGIGILAFCCGVFFKLVKTWTMLSPILSFPGLFLVVLMAWTFQTEFTLSIWLSSLFQACLTVVLLPYLLRKFFG